MAKKSHAWIRDLMEEPEYLVGMTALGFERLATFDLQGESLALGVWAAEQGRGESPPWFNASSE